MSRLIKLPNGLLDGTDLFNVVDIEELKGKQQNYLADKELVVGNIGHIPKILCDLIISIQTAEGLKWQGKIEDGIEKLSSGDLETILITIREETYGPRYYFEVECEHCKHPNKNQRINLDELEVTYMSLEDMLDKSKKVFTLPKSQLEVELKPIYLRDIFEVIKITKNKQNELITSVIALSLKRLGSKTKVTPKDVEELSMKDLMFLQERLTEVKLEGTIDTSIEITCSNCGKDFKSKLDVLSPDFLFPSKGSQSTNI
jgi:hypothetical protein